MPDAVLDASAVLAYVHREPGGEMVEALLPCSLLSAVNLTEVVTNLVRLGTDPALARAIVERLGCETAPVGFELAFRAGMLEPETRALGLSLGDRSCLALAEQEGVPAVTADEAWSRLSLPIAVTLVR
jgi:PIN domain nuclease of toxin-antitoxin system